MSVVVRCLCGQQFAAAPHLFGKRVPCPSCGSPIQVPAAAPAAPLGLEPRVVQPQTQPQRPAPQRTLAPAPLPARRRKSGGGGVVLAIVGVVLLLFLSLFGFAGYVVYKGVRTALGVGAPELDEDYAVARNRHRTQLTTHGKAPQEWEPLRTPRGATAVRYASSAGSLPAYVDPPPSDGRKRPAVLFLHGGFAYGESDWRMAQPYRDAGFIVMTPVLRGENGQSGSFSLYFDEVEDVLAAAATLAQLPYVDSDKIFIAGHSAGGSLTALAALGGDRFRGAAALSGCMDQRLNADIAPFASDEDEYNIRSPVAYAKSFKCPARLYYGSQEILLGPGNRETADRADAAGLDVQAVSVPGDHFTSVDPAIRRSIAFFQQLGGASTPASQTAPSTSIAGSSIPNITPPSSPNIRQPDFPTIPTPSFPTPNFPSTPTIPTPTPHIPNIPNPAAPGFGGRRSATRSQAVVTFEIKAFNGRGPESFAARRSLVGIRWVNIADIRVDKPKGLIVVGVRGNSVSTAEAKKKLEENGFTIGSTSYRPSGLPD